MVRVISWIFSRVGIIYVIILFFCLTCVDFKMLQMRIKTRYLNDSIPDFSDMIIFSHDPDAKKDIHWQPYRKYFELILKFMPEDVITKQLLGYVDYYLGENQKAVDLFKGSSSLGGHPLFWSNYDLGVLYYKQGQWPQAAQSLFQAITASPQLAVYFMENSIVYRQIFTSPSFKYSLSDEMNDAESKAYVLLLSSLYHMGQYDKVVYIANLGIANPHLSYKDAFYYDAALGFLEEGQVEKAFVLFQKSLDLEKDNPDVYYYIAGIYQHAGQLEKAKSFLEASYALHQKNDPRFPYESRINLRFF